MNLIVVPYHDWRKIEKEGYRTRDAHFIEEFRNNKEIDKVIIVNRPVTYAEILAKRKSFQIKGRVILKKDECKLIALDDKTFVIDIILPENLNHLLQKRGWYFQAYENTTVISFFLKSLQEVIVNEDYCVLSQNIMASNFLNYISPRKIFFDAWDNFLLMPGLNSINILLEKAYTNYSVRANLWYTNSQENITYYKRHFNVNSITLLKNGVDFKHFKKNYKKPKDLQTLRSPIVGFGGKITHLFDFKLFNSIVKDNKDFDFVIVGQILDHKIFKKIRKASNFHFLGDKHYSVYPAYVQNFDICIVPYVVGNKQHGGESIKVYEYLAAGRKVIGTRGNGLQDLSDYLFIADTPEEFSSYLKQENNKQNFTGEEFSWRVKANKIIQDFQSD